MRTPRGRSSHAEDRHARQLVLVIGSIALLFCLLATLFITRWARIGALERDLASLHREQAEAQDVQDALRLRLSLANDPETLEDLARENLGLIYRGEEKVYFVED